MLSIFFFLLSSFSLFTAGVLCNKFTAARYLNAGRWLCPICSHKSLVNFVLSLLAWTLMIDSGLRFEDWCVRRVHWIKSSKLIAFLWNEQQGESINFFLSHSFWGRALGQALARNEAYFQDKRVGSNPESPTHSQTSMKQKESRSWTVFIPFLIHHSIFCWRRQMVLFFSSVLTCDLVWQPANLLNALLYAPRRFKISDFVWLS